MHSSLKLFSVSYLLITYYLFLLFLSQKLLNEKRLYDPLISDPSTVANRTFWKYQCIDTMKYSRDTARNWEGKEKELSKEIEFEMKIIKETGANCVAVASPYDDEFIPFLTQWVAAARSYDLHVWFRGNFSGWENWFDYPSLSSRQEHVEKTSRFITENPHLFEDGDIFSPAPEPENGIFGDPRQKERKEFNEFLKNSYSSCVKSFQKIEKNVKCGLFSMNYDVAYSSVDKNTVEKTGKVIAIDHYIKNAENYAKDLDAIYQKFQSKIFIGEFGGPIPDLNGNLREEEQAKLVEKLLNSLYLKKDIILGVNYWTLRDASSELIRKNQQVKPAYHVLQKYFSPGFARGYTSPFGEVKTENGQIIKANAFGKFTITLTPGKHKISYGSFSKNAEITSGQITIVQ